MKYEIRRIEAWREPEGGWSWNNSFTLETRDFDEEDLTNRKILRFLRDERGYLTEQSKGRVRVEDPNGMGEIIEIQDKGTFEPLFALMKID